MRPLADCRLYTFVDTAYLNGRAPTEIAKQLCDGGSDLIQLRAKNLPEDQVRRLAESIYPITQNANVWFVINDHPDIPADICHLGQEDFFDAGHTHVRELPHPIGLSTHAPEQAERALAAEPAYIAIGPIYATGTKPTAKPVTLNYVHWAAANVKILWFAIGGVNLQTLDAVLDAGALRVCVVSAILNSPDIAKTCREFRERLPS